MSQSLFIRYDSPTVFQAQMKRPRTPTPLSPPPPPPRTLIAHTATSSTIVCSRYHGVPLVILVPVVIMGSVRRNVQCVRVGGTEEEDSQFVTSGVCHSFVVQCRQNVCTHNTDVQCICCVCMHCIHVHIHVHCTLCIRDSVDSM